MHQFIQGTEAAFHDLEQRARRACIEFRDQPMPEGALPAKARVGFEVNPSTNEALLLVESGIRYNGSHQDVAEWLQAGSKQFSNFAELKGWIRERLALAYEAPSMLGTSLHRGAPATTHPPRPETLTNLEAVQEHLPDYEQPAYLSEERLAESLKQLVLGQDEALSLLARRVCHHLGRRHPSRPGTLFLVGPTGVGKTLTAQSLASALNELLPDNQHYNYLRLDMVEYQERHRVSQLLGSPPGYIGYEDGSALLDALLSHPKTIVLFDEIEKAHRDILQSLMNAMDAGRLSSPRPRQGTGVTEREVDCRSAIFLFTSNLDATRILNEVEAQDAFNNPVKIEQICRTQLRLQGIAPELIGRITTFALFRPLMLETRARILTLSIARVAEEYGLQIAYIEPALITSILEMDAGNHFGVRPDMYLVDDLLGDAFAKAAVNYRQIPLEVRAGPPVECVPYQGQADDNNSAS